MVTLPQGMPIAHPLSILFCSPFFFKETASPLVIDILASLPLTVASLKGIVFGGNVPLRTCFNCGPRGRLTRKESVTIHLLGRVDSSVLNILLKRPHRADRMCQYHSKIIEEREEKISLEKKVVFLSGPTRFKVIRCSLPPISWVNWEKSSPLLQRER